MTEEPKDIEGTEKGLESQTKQTIEVSVGKKKKLSKVLLSSTIAGVFLTFSISGWFFYNHFSHHSETANGANYYVTIPEIVVNLRSISSKGNILRSTFALQIYNKQDEPKIREFMPIILDQMLSYLRDQSINDLEGPGLERMREAILLRVNNVVRPIKVHRVVLKDFIIQ